MKLGSEERKMPLQTASSVPPSPFKALKKGHPLRKGNRGAHGLVGRVLPSLSQLSNYGSILADWRVQTLSETLRLAGGGSCKVEEGVPLKAARGATWGVAGCHNLIHQTPREVSAGFCKTQEARLLLLLLLNHFSCVGFCVTP